MMKWQGIVIHHTAGHDSAASEVESLRRLHKERGWADVGYHLVIEKLGDRYEAVIGRPWYMPGSHAPGRNQTHLGVVFVGDFTFVPPDDRMLELAARVIAGMCASFGFTILQIEPHKASKATECPGKAFPIAQLLRMVDSLL